MNLKTTTVLATALLVSVPALAQDDERPYDASVALGYVGTTGNTDTTTFNAEVLVTLRANRWTHNGKFQGLASQEDDVASAERYYLEDKSDFSLDADQYLFIKGNYTDDRFSGFDYQAAVSAGYGRYLIRNDTITLEAFGGAGYRQNAIINAGSEGEGIISLGENFSWQLGATTALTQSLTSEIGADLTVTRFEIGLVSNIMDHLATKIAFQARNTSEVPAGNEKTDTQTSVSLVYTF